MAATRFIVIDMQEGNIDNRWWNYATRADAEEKFHYAAAEAVKSPIEVQTIMLVDSEGNTYRRECYTHAASDATPESEPEQA